MSRKGSECPQKVLKVLKRFWMSRKGPERPQKVLSAHKAGKDLEGLEKVLDVPKRSWTPPKVFEGPDCPEKGPKGLDGP